jgi:putative membrane protein
MRNIVMLAVASAFIASPAISQVNADNDSSSVRTTTTPPAVANPNDVNKTTAAPVPGKNSFTEQQVMKRLEENGYSTVSGLTKDEQSIWHGKATKSGKPVTVAVDYQGNITAK